MVRPDGIVCFSTDPWGDVKRPGQLMLRLAERVPVIYAEPGLSVTSVVKNLRSAGSPEFAPRIRRALSGNAEKVAPNVHVVTTLVSIPPQRISGFAPGSSVASLAGGQQLRLSRAARAAAAGLGVRSPVVWASYPLVLGDAFSGSSCALVYDCMDRWSDFPDAAVDDKWASTVSSAEESLTTRADLVFCSAAGLLEGRRSAGARRPVLLRNAADVEHFAPAARAVPDDVRGLPRPVVGYVGAVAGWVDFDLLRAVALARPEWSIVLVGPVFRGKTTGDPRALEAVRDLPNIHLLGPRAYEDVPAYVEAFDVATIPFKLNGLTEDTNPIKVYEYLAAGVPVVSTALPEVAGMRGVATAVDAAAFVSATETAVRERHDRAGVAARIALAVDNSWEARADVAWREIVAVAGGEGGGVERPARDAPEVA